MNKDLCLIRKNYLMNLFLYDLLNYVPIFLYIFDSDLYFGGSRNYYILNLHFKKI